MSSAGNPKASYTHRKQELRILGGSTKLAQLTLLEENFKNFRGKTIDVGLWISFEASKPDVVKTFTKNMP